MKNRKYVKVLALAMIFAMLLSFAACGKKGGEAETRDNVVIAITSESGTTDPIGTSGGYSAVVNNYSEALLEADPQNNITWKLAESVDIIADDDYIYHLRKGVKFNNGADFTAEDVLFSLYLYRDTTARNSWVRAMDWERTHVIDDYTIEICYAEVLASQYPAGIAAIYITDSGTYDPVKCSTSPIGTGPYAVKEYVANSHTILEARDDYWGDKPAIKNVEIRVMAENSQLTNALESKTIDYAIIGTTDAAYLKEKGFNVIANEDGRALAIDFDCSKGSPFESVEARYAVCYAINRASLTQLVYDGYGSTTNWPASTGTADYDPRFGELADIYKDPYNVEKAKQLADKSGLTGKTITIMTNGTEEYNTAAQVISDNLKEIGVTVKVVQFDTATYMSYMQNIDSPSWDIGIFQTMSNSRLAIHTLGNWLIVYPSGWSGEERDALWKLGRQMIAIMDPAERTEQMLSTGYVQRWAEDCPWAALVNRPTMIAANPDLKGIEWNVVGDLEVYKLHW